MTFAKSDHAQERVLVGERGDHRLHLRRTLRMADFRYDAGVEQHSHSAAERIGCWSSWNVTPSSDGPCIK